MATWQPQQCCTACFGFRKPRIAFSIIQHNIDTLESALLQLQPQKQSLRTHLTIIRCCTARVILQQRRIPRLSRPDPSKAMPVLHSLVHQLSESVPPTVMPVLHSSAPQQHLRLLRHRLMCAVLHSLCIACA